MAWADWERRYQRSSHFELSLPKGPDHLNTDLMTADEIRSFLDNGLDDIENGRSVPAKEFFANFRRLHADD